MAEKRYENKEMQKHFENTRSKGSGEHAGKKTMGKHEPEENENSIEEHVAEHGPADHVEIHSSHGGAMHKSMHHDAESAHEHIHKAFGGEPMGENNENAEEMGGTDSEHSAGGAPAIPTMA